jgi:cysteine desulfurase/selenocysteine lyase
MDVTAPMQPATSAPTRAADRVYDVERIRADFPVLHQQINGHPLVYLDNAATAQKPQCVIDELVRYYTSDNANIHRGVHALSIRATEAYERSRRAAQRFIGAAEPEEIIFTRSTTEGVNLVAQSYGRTVLREGDEILISTFEHHSNIVPWQMLCEQTGARLKVAPINDAGELMIDAFERLLTERTRIVSLAHVSNALGTINPLATLIPLARAAGATVVVDGAQAAPHTKIDVCKLDCDFYLLSSHKMYGPTGVGVVYGRRSLLERMPPYQGGGEMIKSVAFEKTVYNDVPHKFEAGTPNIADVVAFRSAVVYLEGIGMDRISAHEHELLGYGTRLLSEIPAVRLVGTASNKAAVLSFVVDGVHAHDVGTVLDGEGIAVRTGHHCAQPVMDRFGVPATARASLGLYNTKEELDALAGAIRKVVEVFG